jgi:hypothetical protein
MRTFSLETVAVFVVMVAADAINQSLLKSKSKSRYD